MKAAVIGLGFGDEGKGLVTNYLCSNTNPLVIRYSGGQQAGHTVVKDGVRHIFSNFGSGTLSGAATYWSKFCTVDPIGLVNELQSLLDKGVHPLLFIDKACPITTPLDVKHNQTLIRDIKNGTCGVGVGVTMEREANHYSLLIGDIAHYNVFMMKIKQIEKYYKIHGKIDLMRFLDCILKIKFNPHIKFVDKSPNSFNTIYEGSQGLLLDPDIGFFPHVTRSNVGTKNIITKKNYSHLDLYLVTRAYQTRHGIGPMTNINIPHNILADENETNTDHKYQGAFRRTLLDMDLLLYGMEKDPHIKYIKKRTLVITCLDHIVNEYRYTHKGQIVFCNNELEFVDQIRSLLGFDSVLVSRSPESSKIERWI